MSQGSGKSLKISQDTLLRKGFVTKLPEISDDCFKFNIVFIVDLTYLNELNEKHQTGQNTMCEMTEIIFSFGLKL